MPKASLDQAAVLDVAGELDRQRAERAAHAVIGIGLGAVLQDPRHGREGHDVVDERRLAEEALERRDRRLGPHDAALALQALQQRGLLAADIGAGAEPDLQVEGLARAQDVVAEHAGRRRRWRSPPSGCAKACGYSERR